jgi:hypothetical protein
MESAFQLQILSSLQILWDIGGTVLRANFYLQALCFSVFPPHKEHEENIRGLLPGCLVVESLVLRQNVLRF